MRTQSQKLGYDKDIIALYRCVYNTYMIVCIYNHNLYLLYRQCIEVISLRYNYSRCKGH